MSENLTIAERVSAAKAEIGPVPKNAFNQHGKYKYASVDDVYHAVRPVMAKHGLDCKLTRTEKAIVESAKGTPWLHLTYEVWLEAAGVAEARQVRDIALPLTGPQAFEAAVSYVKKQYLRGRFEIETGEYDADETAPATADDPVPAAAPAPTGRWEQGDDLVYTWEGEGEPDDPAYRSLYALLAKALQPREWTPAEAEAAHKFAEANRKVIGTLPDGGRKKIEEYWSALPDPETGEVA